MASPKSNFRPQVTKNKKRRTPTTKIEKYNMRKKITYLDEKLKKLMQMTDFKAKTVLKPLLLIDTEEKKEEIEKADN